jgi:hypothetical protein
VAPCAVSIGRPHAAVVKAPRESAQNKIFLDSFKRLGFKLGVLNASDRDFSRVYADNSYVVYAFPDF